MQSSGIDGIAGGHDRKTDEDRIPGIDYRDYADYAGESQNDRIRRASGSSIGSFTVPSLNGGSARSSFAATGRGSFGMADSELGWFGGQPGSFGGQLMNAVDGAAADAHGLAHGGQGGQEGRGEPYFGSR